MVCTIGPSCCEVDTLCELLRAGMSIARIDLTWGPLDFHIKSLENLQVLHLCCAVLCRAMPCCAALCRIVLWCGVHCRGCILHTLQLLQGKRGKTDVGCLNIFSAGPPHMPYCRNHQKHPLHLICSQNLVGLSPTCALHPCWRCC